MNFLKFILYNLVLYRMSNDLTLNELALVVDDVKQTTYEQADAISQANFNINKIQETATYNTLKLTHLEGKQSAFSSTIAGINSAVSGIRDTVSNATDQLNTLNNKVTTDESILTNTVHELDTTKSTLANVSTQLGVVSTGLTALQAKELSDVSALNSAIQNINDKQSLDSAKITANKSLIDGHTTSIASINTDLTTAKGELVIAHNQIIALQTADVQIKADISSANQLANSAKSAVDSLYTGQLASLQASDATQTTRLDALEASKNVVAPQIPVINNNIAVLQGQVGNLRSAENWAQYPAIQGVEMANKRVERAEAYGFNNNTSLFSDSNKKLYVRNWDASSFPPVTTISFIPSNGVGVYNAVNGGLRANPAGSVSNFNIPQGYSYLVVDTKPIKAVRMWDGLEDSYLIGGDVMIPTVEVPLKDASNNPLRLGVAPEEGEEDTRPLLYGGLFQVPTVWHPGVQFNKNIRFTTYDVLTVAETNGVFNSAFYIKNARTSKDISRVNVVDDVFNIPDMNVIKESDTDYITMSVNGSICSYAPLPKYNDSTVKADIQTVKADILANTGEINALKASKTVNEEQIGSLINSRGLMNNSIATIQSNQATDEANISLLQTKVGNIETELNPINASYPTVQSDVTALKNDNTVNKTDITNLKTQVASNLANISTLSQAQQSDETTLASHTAQLSSLTTQIGTLVTTGAVSQWSDNIAVSDVDMAGYPIVNVSGIVTNPASSTVAGGITFKQSDGNNWFGLGIKGSGEKTVRIIKGANANDLSVYNDSFTLDTYFNPPEVRASNPGQLQIRAVHTSGAGLSYIGSANNYAPRSYFTVSNPVVAVTSATPVVVGTASASLGNQYTGFGVYSFQFVLNQWQNSGGSIASSANCNLQYVVEWSPDNSTWSQFNAIANGGHYCLSTGKQTLTFVASEGSGSPTAPSGSVIFFRIKVGNGSNSSLFYQLDSNVLLTQLR
jgi:predicted  nucleic acid-binding Zn-ribbon protein